MKIDQSRNGVRVIKHEQDGGTIVEADCACLGVRFRVHSNPKCPVLVAARSEDADEEGVPWASSTS